MRKTIFVAASALVAFISNPVTALDVTKVQEDVKAG